MAERSKAAVLKTVSGETRSGFESPSLATVACSGGCGDETGLQALIGSLQEPLRARIPVPPATTTPIDSCIRAETESGL